MITKKSTNTESAQAGSVALATKQLHVAVGVIIRDNQVLLSLRSKQQHQGGKWEFPGGKVEAGETVYKALARELQEELAITVAKAEPFMQQAFSYPERNVLLDIYLVTDFTGQAQGVEGQPLQWVSFAQLSELNFPDANQPIVEKLQRQFM
jgi:8-oxo-dGTP diphosphatase